MKKYWTLGCVLAALSTSAFSQERVHSDLPLFPGTKGELHPTNFFEDGAFGCRSRVALGDWIYEPANPEDRYGKQWLRLRNYGVFHCAAIESWASKRESLDRTGPKYSWFVELGSVRANGSRIELWTLQSGHRPGSDYLLLARQPEAGIIRTFNVLPVDCPSHAIRKGQTIDVWRTDYCALNSPQELRAFAASMARRPPIGTLSFVGLQEEEESD